MTPLSLFLDVLRMGGHLDIAGEKLRLLLPKNSPSEIREAILHHKSQIMELLRLTFCVVQSDTVKEIVIWCPDDSTKDCLVIAGAEPGIVYTASELRQLSKTRCTAADLPGIHAAHKRFEGRIKQP